MSPLSGIRWGSATAAYQIEGGVGRDGKVASIWDEFASRPGATVRGDSGAIACRAYDDPGPMLDAVRWLGLETFRLSIAWSRVISGPDGAPNSAGIAYYRRVLSALREMDVEPAVTLYHWDLPLWLQERGGWTNLATADAFAHFASVATSEFGDLVDDWITINEPFCAAFNGYLSGLHAPGVQDEPTALRAALVQLHAHGKATRTIRAAMPQARIGLALNLSDLEAASATRDDLEALRFADLVENRLFLDTVLNGELPADTAEYFGADAVAAAVRGIRLSDVAEPLDFIGINYYEHNVVRAATPGSDAVVRGIDKLPVPEPHSANGVAVHPTGFARVLLRVAALAPSLPIWVTENGIALHDYLDPDGRCNDVERVAFIESYAHGLRTAVEQGARVEAYYFWSLMDNFEWSHGYQIRYGLFYTHYPTGALTPKASATRYRDLIAGEKSGRGAGRPSMVA